MTAPQPSSPWPQSSPSQISSDRWRNSHTLSPSQSQSAQIQIFSDDANKIYSISTDDKSNFSSNNLEFFPNMYSSFVKVRANVFQTCCTFLSALGDPSHTLYQPAWQGDIRVELDRRARPQLGWQEVSGRGTSVGQDLRHLDLTSTSDGGVQVLLRGQFTARGVATAGLVALV